MLFALARTLKPEKSNTCVEQMVISVSAHIWLLGN